jgi:hypothetical protein
MRARESLVARGPARCLTINLGFWCCFAAATLAALGGAHAQSTDDSLRIYAVDIWQDPPQTATVAWGSINKVPSSALFWSAAICCGNDK